jgi:hypothetical protein
LFSVRYINWKKNTSGMKILNFDRFSALYEAEQDLNEKTVSLIRRIVIRFGTCYGGMVSIADDYKDTLKDLDLVLQAPEDEKIEKLKEIVVKTANAISQPYKEAGVDTAWKEAANKTIEALESLVTQYEGEEEVLKEVFKFINYFIVGYKDHLVKSKQEANKAEAAVKESEVQAINEGIFTTKKGNAKALMKQAITLKAELEAYAEDEGLKSFVSGKLEKVKDHIQRLAELQTSRRKDIDDEELVKIGEELNKIPQDINAKQESIDKSNRVNGNASLLNGEAGDLVDIALEKELEVTKKLQEIAAEEAKKKEEEKKQEEIASRFSIDRDLDPEKISARRKDADVAKFQKLVIDKFKDYEPFDDFDLYQKFQGYGDDGKFGPTTQDIVVALKAGYGLDDDTDIITQELISKIYEEPLDESNMSFIRGFNNFHKASLLEAFDPNKAKKAPRKSGGSSGSNSRKESSEEDRKEDKEGWDNYPCVVNHSEAQKVALNDGSIAYKLNGEAFFNNGRKKDKEGKMVSYSCEDSMFSNLTDTEVQKIIKEATSLITEASEDIESLYDDPGYWKDWKSGLDDSEIRAVKATFGGTDEELKTFGLGKMNKTKDDSGKIQYSDVEPPKITKDSWWYENIEVKYLDKAKELIATPGFEEADKGAYDKLEGLIKYYTEGNIKEPGVRETQRSGRKGGIRGLLIYKTLKYAANDTARWKLTLPDGRVRNYDVDADF